MHLTKLFGSAIFSCALVSSSVIGSAIASPFAANEVRETTQSPDSEGGARLAANNPETIAKLLTAATAVERYKLLSDEDYKYDFKHPPTNASTKGAGGRVVRADRKLMPALIGTGTSMAIGFLDGCGFNTPHVHPRSVEFNLVVRGALHGQFVAENGASIVRHNATEFQAMIFPKGAVHTEFNPNCEKAVFVAGFADEDPGVQQSAQALFALDNDVLQSALATETFAGEDLDKFKELIPANVHHGVADCLKRCEGKIEKHNDLD